MESDSPQSRLTHEQRVVGQAAQQAQAATEYAQAEDLLRADRARTSPPPELESRLRHSVSQEPPPPARPWWKRWWPGA